MDIDKDKLPIEVTNNLHEWYDNQTYIISTVKIPNIIRDTLESSEGLGCAIKLWKIIEELSTVWAQTHEVISNGKKIWALVKFESQRGRQSKVMFVSASRAKKRFSIKKNQYIPNIAEIVKYFDDYNSEVDNYWRKKKWTEKNIHDCQLTNFWKLLKLDFNRYQLR